MRHLALPLLVTALAVALAPAHAQTCSARSSAHAATVVELYTSEGCNSCPPADRWMSALKTGPDVVALAFHVDYWDRLGWADRFASPAFTQRQVQQQAVNGSRYSYTPQVVVNGADRKDWPAMSEVPPAPGLGMVDISLMGDASGISATVQSRTSLRLAAYWAVTESGHVTPVKGGENAGATLRHDHVVRELLQVSAWQAMPGTSVNLRFKPATPPDNAHPRRVNLVVVNADTGKPVQALSLGC